MGRYDRYDGVDDFREDFLIAYYHPDFRDLKPVDALQELYRYRREQRREEHREHLRDHLPDE